jgi:hypothetical protein
MTAAWGSTFFLIKDVVTRIPVADLLAIRFAIASVALGLIAAPRLHLSRSVLSYGVPTRALVRRSADSADGRIGAHQRQRFGLRYGVVRGRRRPC